MARLRIHEVLQEKRITMAKLSRMADLSYNTVQVLTKNPDADVTLSTLNKIAAALDVKVSDLLEEGEAGIKDLQPE